MMYSDLNHGAKYSTLGSDLGSSLRLGVPPCLHPNAVAETVSL